MMAWEKWIIRWSKPVLNFGVRMEEQNCITEFLALLRIQKVKEGSRLSLNASHTKSPSLVERPTRLYETHQDAFHGIGFALQHWHVNITSQRMTAR